MDYLYSLTTYTNVYMNSERKEYMYECMSVCQHVCICVCMYNCICMCAFVRASVCVTKSDVLMVSLRKEALRRQWQHRFVSLSM